MAGLADFLTGITSGIAPKTKQNRALANAAIEQLSQFDSPNAQYWAKSLDANPTQALRTAEEYGGIGAVQNSIASAQAQARAQRALAQSMDGGRMTPDQLGVFQAYGPDGLKKYQESRKINAELEEVERISGMSRDKLVDYWARKDPAKAKALAQMWGKAGLNPEAIRQVRSNRVKVADDFNALFGAYKAAKTADVDSPEWGQALTILINKVLQPNSAVLEGEAEATARSVQSALEKAGIMVEGIYNPQTPLGREARVRVVGLIEQLTKTAMKDYLGRHDGWAKANAPMGIEGVNDLFARPGFERLDEIRGEMSKIGSSSKASAAPVGTRRTIPDPKTGEPIEVEKGADGWDRVQ